MKVFRNKEVNLRKMRLKVLKAAAPRNKNKNRKMKRQNNTTFLYKPCKTTDLYSRHTY